MDLVVDANILFSALIRNSVTAQLLVRMDFHLFAPEFLFEEFSKHKDLIFNKTKRTETDFYSFLEDIKEIITIVPRAEFEDYVGEAENISPDVCDAQYLALALKLKCAIWSNDKKLKEQELVRIYSTEELTRELIFRNAEKRPKPLHHPQSLPLRARP